MSHIYGIDGKGQDLVRRAAAIAAETAGPAAADVDAKGRFPKEAVSALAAGGFHGLAVPADAGGLGRGPRDFCGVVEELAGTCPSTAMVYVMHVTAAQAIAASARFPARAGLLKEIAAGRHLTTLAFSEKGSRSQFWMPVSSLTPAGDAFTTRAHKSWVTAAGQADTFVSSAQVPGAAKPTDSVVYLLRRQAPGVRVVAPFDGLGLRGNDSAAVDLEDAAVRPADFLSEPGAGLGMMLQTVLPWFSIGSAAMAHGICRAAVAATAAHLAGSGFEPGGARLRDLPVLRARLAEMSVRTEASRALLGHTLGLLEAPVEATPLFVLQSRLAAVRAAIDVTDLAMKACGGAAFSRRLPLERQFRDARAGWVMAPTAHHLEDFVGRALTGLPLL